MYGKQMSIQHAYVLAKQTGMNHMVDMGCAEITKCNMDQD